MQVFRVLSPGAPDYVTKGVIEERRGGGGGRGVGLAVMFDGQGTLMRAAKNGVIIRLTNG